MVKRKIAVAGAGTMGAGIAQVFAQHGFKTILFDVDSARLDSAKTQLTAQFAALVSKSKITAVQQAEALSLLEFVNEVPAISADIIIEAIIEKLEVKRQLFSQLYLNNPGSIFCSNTSSLSITKIASGMPNAGHIAGLHFFNPAPVMRLVEIVKGAETSDETIAALTAVCEAVGKTSVICKDSPGFIVNRVARHYYVESLKLVEEGVSTIENTDALLEAAGFKMGPFKLMDTIGNDINFAVTSSLFEAFHQDPKFRPARLQRQKVEAGQLGKKTGKGFYDWA